jgi:hypothetical protein
MSIRRQGDNTTNMVNKFNFGGGLTAREVNKSERASEMLYKKSVSEA